MDIKFYNYRTRKIEEFKPVGDTVGLYTCGPTVYNSAHLGNLRTYLFEDLLKRVVSYFGYPVNHVMNLTDVEDKIIKTAVEQGKQIDEVTAPYIERFRQDLEKLNIQPATVYPKATEHIQEMIDLINRLVEKGVAYEADGSVYFAIRKFVDYGKLTNVAARELQAGARVDVDEYEKDAAEDFVLWKAVKSEDEQVGAVWDSPWGKGRPGWHIECSAMSMKYLGETFDLHAGAIDLLFPHHEDEIAQSEAATGVVFARYFLEGEHLLVDNKKMAKRDNNYYVLADIEEKGIDPLAFRYLVLTTHYRSKMNFTWESIEAAASAIKNLMRLQYEPIKPVEQAVIDQIDGRLADDLDIPGAVAILHQQSNPALWERYESVLGLGFSCKSLEIDTDIEELLGKREEARKQKDYALADQVRDEIRTRGYEIDDTPTGPKLMPINK